MLIVGTPRMVAQTESELPFANNRVGIFLLAHWLGVLKNFNQTWYAMVTFWHDGDTKEDALHIAVVPDGAPSKTQFQHECWSYKAGRLTYDSLIF